MENQGVLGVGLTVKCDDPNMESFGPALDEAQGLGVDFVEIPLLTMDLIVGGRILKDRLARIRRETETRDLRYTVHAAIGLDFMDEPYRIPLHKDVCKASIEVAAELNAVHMVLHTGFADDRQMAGIELAYARQREHLAEMGDFAAEHDVVLCVENIFTYQRSRHNALPSRLAAELKQIGHPNVMATFDVSHGMINSTLQGADFLAEAETLAPFAKHLHVHDSFGRPKDINTYTIAEDLAYGVGDLHLPLGWGTVPFDAIAERCRFADGVVANIELNARYWSEVEATVKAAKAFVAKLNTVEAVGIAAE